MVRMMGMAFIIPMTLLLTISFFVLFALRKETGRRIRLFGYVVAVLLWVSSAIVLSAGIYTVATGKHPMIVMTQQMMKQSEMPYRCKDRMRQDMKYKGIREKPHVPRIGIPTQKFHPSMQNDPEK